MEETHPEQSPVDARLPSMTKGMQEVLDSKSASADLKVRAARVKRMAEAAEASRAKRSQDTRYDASTSDEVTEELPHEDPL